MFIIVQHLGTPVEYFAQVQNLGKAVAGAVTGTVWEILTPTLDVYTVYL